MTKNSKSIILLSGGLDSAVSLALAKEEYNVSLALTFDYGQKSAKSEITAAANLANYYKIQHQIISLNWLKAITHTSLVADKNVPEGIQNSSDSVWVPNRNGLFLNIAGSYADGENYTYIIIGANKEEAKSFSDNTQEFINRINSEFEYSTRVKPKVIAPLINYNKNDIVKTALKHDVPLEYIHSCYTNNGTHCGKCESCTRLKNALKTNGDDKYIRILFK